jgi:hypothetical protein
MASFRFRFRDVFRSEVLWPRYIEECKHAE